MVRLQAARDRRHAARHGEHVSKFKLIHAVRNGEIEGPPTRDAESLEQDAHPVPELENAFLEFARLAD